MPPDCGRSVVVLGEQLGLDPAGDRLPLGCAPARARRRSPPPPRRSAPGAPRPARRASVAAARRAAASSRVERLDLLHQLELLVLELGDPPLERRRSRPAAPGARGGCRSCRCRASCRAGSPGRSATAISSSSRCWSRPSSWRCASTSATRGLERARARPSPRRARPGSAGAPAGAPAGRWPCRAPGRRGGRPSGSCPPILACHGDASSAGRSWSPAVAVVVGGVATVGSVVVVVAPPGGVVVVVVTAPRATTTGAAAPAAGVERRGRAGGTATSCGGRLGLLVLALLAGPRARPACTDPRSRPGTSRR